MKAITKIFNFIQNFIKKLLTFFLGEKNMRKIQFLLKFNTVDFSKKATPPTEKTTQLKKRYHESDKQIVFPDLFEIRRLFVIDENNFKKYPNSNLIDFLYLAQDFPEWRKLLDSYDGKDICAIGDLFANQSGYQEETYVRCLTKRDGMWHKHFKTIETATQYATVIAFDH